MFNRIRNAWRLRNADIVDVSGLSISEIDERIREKNPSHINFGDGMIVSVKGDGKAAFFGPGTEEEFRDLENEDKGLKGVFGL